MQCIVRQIIYATRVASMGREDLGMHRIAGDVTSASYEGWRQFAGAHGISVAAMLEVLGRRMAGFLLPIDDTVTARISDFLNEVREIDNERRRRGKE